MERLIDIQNMKAESRFGRLPIHLAAGAGHLLIVEMLYLESRRFGISIDVPCRDLTVPAYLVPKNNWTSLSMAVSGGHLTVVEYLISQGANMSVTSFDKTTLLHRAALKNPGVFAELLRQGLNPFAEDSVGRTPFHFAAMDGNTAVAEYYLELADTGRSSGRLDSPIIYPLQVAIQNGQSNFALKLLEQGESCNIQDANLTIPLMNAVERGLEDLALKFLEAGADINATDSQQFTALHRAAYSNLPSMVRLLLENGAEKDAQNNIGATSYLFAAERSFTEVMAVLSEFGANTSLPNRLGFTAADFETDPSLEQKQRHTPRTFQVTRELLYELPDVIDGSEQDPPSEKTRQIDSSLLHLMYCFHVMQKEDDHKVCGEYYVRRGGDGEPTSNMLCAVCLKHEMPPGPISICSICNRTTLCTPCNAKRLDGDIPKGCKAEHKYWILGGEDWQRYPLKSINLQGDTLQDWIAAKKAEYGVASLEQNKGKRPLNQ